MISSVCVFCSSSSAVPPGFHTLATATGESLARAGLTLVYGGTTTGLMGEVARAAHAAGGRVVGVIPAKLRELGLANEACDELHITHDLRDRKGLMDELSDAFLALPGGLGTLEEIFEVFNLKYLKYHQKPVVFLNHEGFYNDLFAFFETLYAARFTKRAVEQLYHAAPDLPAFHAYLQSYVPVEVADKWYDRSTDALE